MPGWRSTDLARPMADAFSSNCCESVTYNIYPKPSTLRRIWSWQPFACTGAGLERMAVHEAGHAVLLDWLGLGRGLRATATEAGGLVHLPRLNPPAAAMNDQTGELSATAAAVFHAGTIAEMILCGVAWTGPVYRPRQDDHQRAEALLCGVLGCHSSGGHAFAQQVAMHVLKARWPRVQAIADELVCTGTWRS